MNAINPEDERKLIKTVNSLITLLMLVVVTMFALVLWMLFKPTDSGISDEQIAEQIQKMEKEEQLGSLDPSSDLWTAPSDSELPSGEQGEEIKYGRDLIARTAEFLGPKGKVAQITNGMNCQNCHLNAGTAPYGNNYSAVASTYPKFRGRSGTIETVFKRIGDCFERSLNGQAPDSNSREMKAMAAYIKWVGKDVKKGVKPKGSGLYEVPFLSRAADPVNGKAIYESKCQSCHQANGAGMMNDKGNAYTYPPLWGRNSYNSGAGLYRMSRFAGYVRANMPLGATYSSPQLTNEEAWDVAAFVNSQDRPIKDLSKDWPDISKKNIDHPFGPYIDPFSEKQHKYGPFGEIKSFYDAMKDSKKKG